MLVIPFREILSKFGVNFTPRREIGRGRYENYQANKNSIEYFFIPHKS